MGILLGVFWSLNDLIVSGIALNLNLKCKVKFIVVSTDNSRFAITADETRRAQGAHDCVLSINPYLTQIDYGHKIPNCSFDISDCVCKVISETESSDEL